MITIDGSRGEGGGQVLRTTLTLSILTGRAVEIRNIRADRSKPGLAPQHLTAVRAAATICAAEVEGDQLQSQTVFFHPKTKAQPGVYSFDVNAVSNQTSAGSVGLVLQTVLLPLARADGPSSLTLRGGTHAPWAPSADYVQQVFLPVLGRMGIVAELQLNHWGFFPAGGGEIKVEIRQKATCLTPLELTERGSLQRIWGRGVAGNLPAHIPQRMVDRARNVLASEGLQAQLEPLRVRSTGPGATIFLLAEYEGGVTGFCAYGRKGLASERVAEAACNELLTHHRRVGLVDPHLADQLILPMALADGTSQVTTSVITHHLLTNLEIIRAFWPIQAQIEGEQGMPGKISITGSAYD